MKRKNKALTLHKSDSYNNLCKRMYEQNFQNCTNPYVILRPIVRQLCDAVQTATEEARSMLK